RLDLAGLDRIAHAGSSVGADTVGRRSHRAPRADRDRRTRGFPPWWTERDRIGRRERYGRGSRTVNEPEAAVGHRRHGADEPSPPAYLRPPSGRPRGRSRATPTPRAGAA